MLENNISHVRLSVLNVKLDCEADLDRAPENFSCIKQLDLFTIS